MQTHIKSINIHKMNSLNNSKHRKKERVRCASKFVNALSPTLTVDVRANITRRGRHSEQNTHTNNKNKYRTKKTTNKFHKTKVPHLHCAAHRNNNNSDNNNNLWLWKQTKWCRLRVCVCVVCCSRFNWTTYIHIEAFAPFGWNITHNHWSWSNCPRQVHNHTWIRLERKIEM